MGMPGATTLTPGEQREFQDQDAARTSHLFATGNVAPSPSLATTSPVGGSTSLVSTPSADASGDHKLAFLNQPSDRRAQSPERLQDVPDPHVLLAGTIIPAALITGLRSDIPGVITAQVTQDCYDSPTGTILLNLVAGPPAAAQFQAHQR